MKRALLLSLAMTLVGVAGCTCDGQRPQNRAPAVAPANPSQPLSRRAQDPRAARPASLPADHPQVKRAQEVIAGLKRKLKQELLGAMAKGPEAAVTFCAARAQAITAAAATKDVILGRTSHRLRNPKNAARGWVTPLLNDFVTSRDRPTYRTQELSDGRVGYVEPIYTSRLCLTCHGSAVAPSVAKAIKASYPKDHAEGFAPGDVRGVFWAEVAASK